MKLVVGFTKYKRTESQNLHRNQCGHICYPIKVSSSVLRYTFTCPGPALSSTKNTEKIICHHYDGNKSLKKTQPSLFSLLISA